MFNFFKDNYKESDTSRPEFKSSSFKRLDQSDVEYLEAGILEDEVCQAIKDCRSKKAPGPDGFNFSFIKKCWPIIKREIMQRLSIFGGRGILVTVAILLSSRLYQRSKILWVYVILDQ